MSEKKQSFEDNLESLTREYREQLPTRIQEIKDLWLKTEDSQTFFAEGSTLVRLVHTLAGSAATFGYAHMGDKAKRLEGLINQYFKESNHMPPEAREQGSQLLMEVEAASKEQGEPDISPVNLPSPAPQEKPTSKHIFWLGRDRDLSRWAEIQLAYFGFDVKSFELMEHLKTALGSDTPALILIDISPHDQEDNLDFKTQLGQSSEHIPIICLTPSSRNMAFRLQAVRGGAAACLPKPLNFNTLLDKLIALVDPPAEEPYRLLVVDDEELLAKHIAAIMNKAGMTVEVVTDPLNIMNVINSFNPDLVLMDLHMPQCSGLELARIIRQDDRFLAVPIVYLSRETEVNQILAGLESGGDDFIFKPVKYRFLYHALSSRIKRARMVSSYLVRDSLTGLLNHTSFQERLGKAVEESEAAGEELALALIDLDHFKVVNETFGHQQGDLVIKSLAIFLQRRLGPKAVIGRYGGEEFGVVLPKHDEHLAVEAMGQLRRTFSEIIHKSKTGNFQAGFSCGIATTHYYSTVGELVEAADKFLSLAKSQGRNRVVSKESGENSDAFAMPSFNTDTGPELEMPAFNFGEEDPADPNHEQDIEYDSDTDPDVGGAFSAGDIPLLDESEEDLTFLEEDVNEDERLANQEMEAFIQGEGFDILPSGSDSDNDYLDEEDFTSGFEGVDLDDADLEDDDLDTGDFADIVDENFSTSMTNDNDYDDTRENATDQHAQEIGNPSDTSNTAELLVVDDDHQILRLVTSYLEDKGFKVYPATTGDEGFELAKKHKPTLALIDLLLFPGIHGFELCKMIRADKDLKNTKILLMTGVYKDYRYRMEGIEAGADDFIVKPLDFPDLMEKIQRHLAATDLY